MYIISSRTLFTSLNLLLVFALSVANLEETGALLVGLDGRLDKKETVNKATRRHGRHLRNSSDSSRGAGNLGNASYEPTFMEAMMYMRKTQEEEIEASNTKCSKDSECYVKCKRFRCINGSNKGKFCITGTICGKGYCGPITGKCYFGNEGDVCKVDGDCKGYCELGKCYDGSEGDRCNNDSDCQSGLDCGWNNGALKCNKKKGEGSSCVEDDECEGYCELLKCYDGSEGDRCGKDSDCQSGLDCDWDNFKLVCKKKKGEGRRCFSDSECSGYCHDLKCWDGSRGDRCGSSRDCKSKRCKCTHWICTRKRCT